MAGSRDDNNMAGGMYGDGVTLPNSLEAEQAVLGAVLIDASVMDRLEKLLPEHFYMPEHQAIFGIMRSKMIMNQTIDFITVLDALKAEEIFSGDDGKAYLMKLTQIVPSLNNIEAHARIVREKYDARALIRAAREIIDDSMDPGTDMSLMIDSAEQKIYDIRQGRSTNELRHISDILSSNYEMFNKLNSDERDQYIGIPSGIGALDEITTGLNRSDLIILGARPGMGKTSLALNFARSVAMDRKKTVAFFALEMSREQLVNRLLSSEAKVSGKKLRTGMLSMDEWKRLGIAASRLHEAPLYFDDTSDITVPEMKSRLRRLKNVDFVVIDYLQLMQSAKRGGREMNRTNEVAEITRSLKIMAKELHIPLMVCAQLSRATEKQANHRPALADLRDSGSIEQDADQVLFIYRDIYYQQNDNKNTNPADANPNLSEIIVAKNRHGEVGTVKLSFAGEFTTFTGVEAYRDDTSER